MEICRCSRYRIGTGNVYLLPLPNLLPTCYGSGTELDIVIPFVNRFFIFHAEERDQFSNIKTLFFVQRNHESFTQPLPALSRNQFTSTALCQFYLSIKSSSVMVPDMLHLGVSCLPLGSKAPVGFK